MSKGCEHGAPRVQKKSPAVRMNRRAEWGLDLSEVDQSTVLVITMRMNISSLVPTAWLKVWTGAL